MTNFAFLLGRSSGASWSKRPIHRMSLPLSVRAGAGGPPSTGRNPDHTWASSPPRNHGNPCGLDVPSYRRRLQLSTFAWFLRCNRCISADTPTPKASSSGLAHSHRLNNLLPIGVLKSSFWVVLSNSCALGTYANVGIWAKMGLIPSRGPAHDHMVDHHCPSKHQKT
jgi:hypothetical protein